MPLVKYKLTKNLLSKTGISCKDLFGWKGKEAVNNLLVQSKSKQIILNLRDQILL